MSRPLRELVDRLEAADLLLTMLPNRGAVSAPDVQVAGVEYDSRKVGPGSVFVAISGGHADGHDFVETAVRAGATVTLVERPVAGSPLQLIVLETRRALATAAAWWYGDPSLELGVIGITGTDGKTTTSYLAASVLEAAGISTGVTTTASVKIGREWVANPEHVTTPQAPELQARLREMVAAGNEAVILETTSHGLALHRVDEIAYDIAIFTNLTHEHLELHGTFEAYRDAKVSLFERIGRGPGGQPRAKRLSQRWPKMAVVNVDDPSAPYFLEAARTSGAGTITYGLTGTADVTATEIDEDVHGLRFTARTPRWQASVRLQLAGRFNVLNALAAIALGEALELDPVAIRSGLSELAGVPGRMERIDCGQPFGVVVDYAHSPAALEKVLDILKPLTGPGAGLIAVFGSAGERDVQKRPIMGRVAAER